MNDLSWLLYIAGLVENLQHLFGTFGFCGFITFIVLVLFISAGSKWNGLNTTLMVVLFIAVASSGLFAVAIPSKETIYMIGASEAAELGLDKLNTLSKDESSLVFKGLKKLEEVLEVKYE